MVAQEAGGERNYKCAEGHLVLITAATGERIRAVYCRTCRQRVTVYLEGYEDKRKRPPGPGIQTLGDGDPRHPPIETRTATGRPAGQGRRA